MPSVASNFFSRLSHQDGLRLESYLQTGSAAKGTVIISLDDPTDRMYFILTGGCSIYEKTQVGDEELCLNTATLQAPIFLGEGALLNINQRSAAVVAHSDVTYMSLSQKNFLDMQKNDPDLAFLIIQYVAQDLHQRFHSFEEDVRIACNENAQNKEIVMRRLNQYIGKIKHCPTDLARKLFYFNNDRNEG